MKKIAIVYATRYGQTEKIARYIAKKIQQPGISTRLVKANTKQPPESDVDSIICGGPVYRGNFPGPLLAWVRTNLPFLADHPCAFFSVTLNAADKHDSARTADDDLLKKFMTQTAWTPSHLASIAGALKYRDYFWLLRILMKRISRKAGGDIDTSKNYEYTDWEVVDGFVDAFLHQKKDSVYATAVRFPHMQACTVPLSN